jgi:hypothetical protein
MSATTASRREAIPATQRMVWAEGGGVTLAWASVLPPDTHGSSAAVAGCAGGRRGSDARVDESLARLALP